MKVLYVYDDATPWPFDLMYSLRALAQNVVLDANDTLDIFVAGTQDKCPIFLNNITWLQFEKPLVDANSEEQLNYYVLDSLRSIVSSDSEPVLLMDQRVFIMSPVHIRELVDNQACYPVEHTAATKRALLLYGKHGGASGFCPLGLSLVSMQHMIDVIGYNADVYTVHLCGKRGNLVHAHVDANGGYKNSHFLTYDSTSGLSKLSAELTYQLHVSSKYDNGFDAPSV